MKKLLQNKIMKQLWTVTILFLLCAAPVSAKMVSIANEIVNMRSGPSQKNAVLWELGKGYPLKVIGSQGTWYKVIDYENDTGWIYKKLVNRTPHLVVKKKIINIRSGPGKKYRIIRQAKKGVVFTTLKRNNSGWIKIRHEETQLVGWVKRSLLWGW